MGIENIDNPNEPLSNAELEAFYKLVEDESLGDLRESLRGFEEGEQRIKNSEGEPLFTDAEKEKLREMATREGVGTVELDKVQMEAEADRFGREALIGQLFIDTDEEEDERYKEKMDALEKVKSAKEALEIIEGYSDFNIGIPRLLENSKERLSKLENAESIEKGKEVVRAYQYIASLELKDIYQTIKQMSESEDAFTTDVLIELQRNHYEYQLNGNYAGVLHPALIAGINGILNDRLMLY